MLRDVLYDKSRSLFFAFLHFWKINKFRVMNKEDKEDQNENLYEESSKKQFMNGLAIRIQNRRVYEFNPKHFDSSRLIVYALRREASFYIKKYYCMSVRASADNSPEFTAKIENIEHACRNYLKMFGQRLWEHSCEKGLRRVMANPPSDKTGRRRVGKFSLTFNVIEIANTMRKLASSSSPIKKNGNETTLATTADTKNLLFPQGRASSLERTPNIRSRESINETINEPFFYKQYFLLLCKNIFAAGIKRKQSGHLKSALTMFAKVFHIIDSLLFNDEPLFMDIRARTCLVIGSIHFENNLFREAELMYMRAFNYLLFDLSFKSNQVIYKKKRFGKKKQEKINIVVKLIIIVLDLLSKLYIAMEEKNMHNAYNCISLASYISDAYLDDYDPHKKRITDIIDKFENFFSKIYFELLEIERILLPRLEEIAAVECLNQFRYKKESGFIQNMTTKQLIEHDAKKYIHIKEICKSSGIRPCSEELDSFAKKTLFNKGRSYSTHKIKVGSKRPPQQPKMNRMMTMGMQVASKKKKRRASSFQLNSNIVTQKHLLMRNALYKAHLNNSMKKIEQSYSVYDINCMPESIKRSISKYDNTIEDLGYGERSQLNKTKYKSLLADVIPKDSNMDSFFKSNIEHNLITEPDKKLKEFFIKVAAEKRENSAFRMETGYWRSALQLKKDKSSCIESIPLNSSLISKSHLIQEYNSAAVSETLKRITESKIKKKQQKRFLSLKKSKNELNSPEQKLDLKTIIFKHSESLGTNSLKKLVTTQQKHYTPAEGSLQPNSQAEIFANVRKDLERSINEVFNSNIKLEKDLRRGLSADKRASKKSRIREFVDSNSNLGKSTKGLEFESRKHRRVLNIYELVNLNIEVRKKDTKLKL